jgi:hypothetical protein
MVSARPPVWWPISGSRTAAPSGSGRGFEPRRHQGKIAANPPGLSVVETDHDAITPAVDGAHRPVLLDGGLAAAGHDDLAAAMISPPPPAQVDALLVYQSRDQTEIGPRDSARPNCWRT